MVTVAVGVAVIALWAGAVGSFLKSHQHVHLKKETISTEYPLSITFLLSLNLYLLNDEKSDSYTSVQNS